MFLNCLFHEAPFPATCSTPAIWIAEQMSVGLPSSPKKGPATGETVEIISLHKGMAWVKFSRGFFGATPVSNLKLV